MNAPQQNDIYETLWRFVKKQRYLVLPVVLSALILAAESVGFGLSDGQFVMFRYVGF